MANVLQRHYKTSLKNRKMPLIREMVLLRYPGSASVRSERQYLTLSYYRLT